MNVLTTKRVTANPGIMAGQPCIAGTRIPVWLILRELAGGASRAEIVSEYPSLSDADISAALDFAWRELEGRTPDSGPE
jgi:uncharacterized protein (DUF433 family)